MNIKTLPSKVFNKGLRYISRYVPYNIKYKPIGIVNISRLNKIDSIKYTELNSPYTLDLNLAPKFIEDCSPFAKPILSVEFPGDYVVEVKDGRVYSVGGANMAIISKDNRLIEQISFQWNNDQVLSGKHNVLFKRNSFIKPRKYNGKVFSMLAGGGATNYYYHWLFDSIPKIALLKQIGQFDEIDFFLVPNYVYKYHREYLDYFGIPSAKIINGEMEKHIQADGLLVCSYVRIEDHHPKWVCDFLYSSFITPGKSQRRDKLIYIARGDSAINRKVINEPALIKILERYGFEIHYLSEVSIVEQTRIFNAAKVVVGAHGAGLSNLVFCEPGTKVLEIFPDNYVRHLFYDICNKRGLSYDYILCPSEGIASNSVEGQKISLIADIESIEKKVISLLASL